MITIRIIESSKSGNFPQGFAIFYCKELDKIVICILPFDNSEKDIVISEFKKNNVPSDGYAILIKSSGAIIKAMLTQKVPDTFIYINNFPVKIKNGI